MRRKQRVASIYHENLTRRKMPLVVLSTNNWIFIKAASRSWLLIDAGASIEMSLKEIDERPAETRDALKDQRHN
ncbi:MAG TPA: hypothetical protein VEU96_04510 [Bryobacteraceae bacterium]|nr:hypothetical protein [Bryobacteraceae bacterium]